MVTKKDLLEIIEGINSEVFEVTVHTVEPGGEWDLPDVRIGAIHPPMPMPIIRHKEPSKVEITLAFKEG